MALFKKLKDVFAWTYEEILGIDPSIVVHEIKTYPGVIASFFSIFEPYACLKT